MLIVDWLKWFFIPHGIMVVEESGKIGWLQAFVRLLSGAVKRYPDGPTESDFMGYARLKMRVKRHKCEVCNVYFWSWKKRKICHKFGCYRRRNESK